jgi:hypothetical protein
MIQSRSLDLLSPPKCCIVQPKADVPEVFGKVECGANTLASENAKSAQVSNLAKDSHVLSNRFAASMTAGGIEVSM